MQDADYLGVRKRKQLPILIGFQFPFSKFTRRQTWTPLSPGKSRTDLKTFSSLIMTFSNIDFIERYFQLIQVPRQGLGYKRQLLQGNATR